jgi:hypothetical protein
MKFIDKLNSWHKEFIFTNVGLTCIFFESYLYAVITKDYSLFYVPLILTIFIIICLSILIIYPWQDYGVQNEMQ